MIPFKPTVFWLTGLSGTGKTTLAEILTQKLRNLGHPVILLDGDILRELFDGRIGHDRESRFIASMQYARLCKILVTQNIHVVCATISLFHQTQQWNRKNINNYMEILIDTPYNELVYRDSKKIYSRGLSGELENVVGIDINPEFPTKPDIIINNNNGTLPETHVALILEKHNATTPA